MSTVGLSKSLATEVIGRARTLAPLLTEHAAEAERLRRPVDAVIRALEDAEIFKLMVPRRHGGFELDLDTFFDVGVALGEGDASMAWVANFYIEHNWILCHFPETFQEQIFAARGYVLAPVMFAPSGTAFRDGDGRRLRGRWQWASGIAHADWVVPGALEMTDDGPPQAWLFAMPASDVRVEDTWYVDGMSGTGSADVVIDDLFVPKERCLTMQEMMSGDGPGSQIHNGPLYRTPMFPILTLAAAMPALGQARVCVRRFRERTQERVLLGGVKQVNRASVHIRLARAELLVTDAESLMRQTVQDVCARRNAATIEDRARWAAQLALGVDYCKQAIRAMCEISGGSTHFLNNPMQRALRDVETLSSHMVFDLDQRLEVFGRALLGLELSFPMV